MNITKYEFSTVDLAFNAFEKAALMGLWLVIQIPGNIMLVGLIQFDRLGGDPLKRRLLDQVRFKAIYIVTTVHTIVNKSYLKKYVYFLVVYTWLYDSSISESNLLKLIDHLCFV